MKNQERMQVPNWLEHRAKNYAHSLALEFEGKAWTFAQMETESQNLATCLINAGVEPNAKVGILIENSPEFIFSLHALTNIGAIAVLLNPRLSAADLAWQLQHSGATILLHNQALQQLAEQIPFQLPKLSIPFSSLCLPKPFQNLAFSPDISLAHIQSILFTSGTTGKPKGVQLTYGNHFHSAVAAAIHLGSDPIGDRTLVCLPLYHVGGLATVWRSLISVTGLVLHRRFDPQKICQAIAQESITNISLVPTMLKRLLADPEFLPCHWQKLRYILLGGSIADPELIATCVKLQLPIATTYGLTETASQVATLLPQEFALKPRSVGKPLLCCDRLKIVDNQAQTLAADQVGEILIRGANVMKGYLHNPELQDNWLHTGDLGYIDPDGYLYILSRRTDLIISGGENIYPAEIEGILLGHGAIAEVCILAKPDPLWGQSVAAVVVARESLSLIGIQNFCLEQNLARYKLPKHLYQLAELPKTASGKIHRLAIQEVLSADRISNFT